LDAISNTAFKIVECDQLAAEYPLFCGRMRAGIFPGLSLYFVAERKSSFPPPLTLAKNPDFRSTTN